MTNRTWRGNATYLGIGICLLLAVALVATWQSPLWAQEDAETPAVELTGFAVLPADTFADGPPSGQFEGNGGKLAAPRFPAQPVQGFSGVQFGPSCESYYVLSDNGFGAKFNSIDYLLRIYEIEPDPLTTDGGTGTIDVVDHIGLRDPAGLIPFFIVHEFSPERPLTGYDFDLESFAFDGDGTLWVGEEFGPYLLHFTADGLLLDPPFHTPNPGGDVATVQSPQNPGVLAGSPQPGGTSTANLRGSRGFEGMATSPDGMTLYPMLEGTVAGDPDGALRIYEFDVQSKSWITDTTRFYGLADPSHAIGDFTVVNEDEFLVIERDGLSGDAAEFKRIYLINLSQVDAAGYVSKELVVDLLQISDPNNLAGYGERFRFPFVTIEDVLVLDPQTIVVLNDNNYPATGGRGEGIKDPNEMIVLQLDRTLALAEGVGTPAVCQ